MRKMLNAAVSVIEEFDRNLALSREREEFENRELHKRNEIIRTYNAALTELTAKKNELQFHHERITKVMSTLLGLASYEAHPRQSLTRAEASALTEIAQAKQLDLPRTRLQEAESNGRGRIARREKQLHAFFASKQETLREFDLLARPTADEYALSEDDSEYDITSRPSTPTL